MEIFLISAVALLSAANGANDNFKGVATLWGSGRTTYIRGLAWATAFTFLGSLASCWLASGLVEKFNGSRILAHPGVSQPAFLAAVALAAAATVILASLLGLPVSTTHALTGSLVGAGIVAGGVANVRYGVLAQGVVAPLLFSPLAALLLTLSLYPLVTRFAARAASRDCLCVDSPEGVALPFADGAASVAIRLPALRVAASEECRTGMEIVRMTFSGALHWLSAAAISFARGVNDTPKIVALMLFAAGGGVVLNYALVAAAMAAGGMLGAARVARTMSKKITSMDTREAVTANLVSAGLVTLASGWALPVSTTHVTSGSIFGIGLLHRVEADWHRVREILLAWVATLPLATALAMLFFSLLAR